MKAPKVGDIEGLKALIAACDDNAGHHVVWVDYDGCVHISNSRDKSSLAWRDIKFWLESFAQGHGFVGEEAARSELWMGKLNSWLIQASKRDEKGYLDFF